MVARGKRRLGRLEHRGNVRTRATHRGQFLDKLLHAGFRLRTGKAVNRLAIDKSIDCRHGLHPHLLCDLLIIINIHPHHADLAAAGANNLFQNRAELLAGAAPGGPELHDGGRCFRTFNHLGHEVVHRDIDRCRLKC